MIGRRSLVLFLVAVTSVSACGVSSDDSANRVTRDRVPFGLRVQSVQALASGIEFTLAGTNLTFRR